MKLFKLALWRLSLGAAALLLIACQQETASTARSAQVSAVESVASESTAAESTTVQFDVYKDPNCGCCSDWITHMQQAGFQLAAHDSQQLAQIKQDNGVAPLYQSCHTALSRVGDFVFEGHVPAELIKRFLANPPEGARGLAVPGMPVGSPGMERGDRHDAYDVMLLMRDGSASVYQHIASPASH